MSVNNARCCQEDVMSKYIKPRSDQSRITVLEQIHVKALQDQAEGSAYLSPDKVAQVGNFVPQLAPAYQSYQSYESARMNAIGAAAAALADVNKICRAIWRVVKARTQRGGLPYAVRLYYGLPANGRYPKVRRQHEWLTVADIIVQGEAQAVAAGYPALLEPTIESLQTALSAARTAVNQREAAKSAFETPADALIALRLEADSLIADVMGELRYALRQETAAHRRDIMRSYGARFAQKSEDTPEETAVMEEEEAAMETTTAPAAMSMPQSYAAPVLNGNGTAVRV
jgi:hypothetical protein